MVTRTRRAAVPSQDVLIELTGASFAGDLRIHTVTGSSVAATNTFDHPKAVAATEESREIAPSDRFAYSFPPRSVSALVFDI